MIVPGGSTAHFNVSYDDTLPNGQALANDALARCEADLTTLAGIWVGTPVPTNFQVTIVPGGGGAYHVGTNITMYANNNTDAPGISSLLVAEVAEVFMSEQKAALGHGFDPIFSHGEGLSRVLAAELYPAIAGRWGVGLTWLNGGRPDWVTNTEMTDQDGLSYGCASIFLNYLHYQLGLTWLQIVAAADNTLALVAQNLGVQNAWSDFQAVLARHYPPSAQVQPNQVPHDPEGFPIDNLFPLSCLYLRHNLADDGTSHTGPLANSPDIIVKNNAVPNPQATYSTPASIGSDHESDPSVIDTQDNYVYLRVWNLGADARNVTASVYWSQPATLVIPAMWNLIGQVAYPDVPAGRVVEVSSAGITWARANIPAPGHYCFIATVGNAGDPEPHPGSFNSFNDFMAYIENNNNITWRNFNVVHLAGHRRGHFGDFIDLPFLMVGAWDEARAFEFEALAELPKGSELALQVPAWLGHGLKPNAKNLVEQEDLDTDPDDKLRVRIPLEPGRPLQLGKVELKAGAQVKSHVLVRLAKDHHNGAHEIAIRQLFGGVEVGRITWRLVPELPENGEVRRDQDVIPSSTP